jgi:hypothetical protein
LACRDIWTNSRDETRAGLLRQSTHGIAKDERRLSALAMKDVMTVLRDDNLEKALSHCEDFGMTRFRNLHGRKRSMVQLY